MTAEQNPQTLRAQARSYVGTCALPHPCRSGHDREDGSAESLPCAGALLHETRPH